MRFLVEVGKPRGAGGGLSKLRANEALIVFRELTERGLKGVWIVDAKTGEAVTEADLERLAGKKMK